MEDIYLKTKSQQALEPRFPLLFQKDPAPVISSSFFSINEPKLVALFLEKNDHFRDLTGLDLNLYRSSEPSTPLHRPNYNSTLIPLLDRCGALKSCVKQAGLYTQHGDPFTLFYPLNFASTTIPLKGMNGSVLNYHLRLEGYFLDQGSVSPTATQIKVLQNMGFSLDREEIFRRCKTALRLSWKKLDRLVSEMTLIAKELSQSSQADFTRSSHHPGISKGISFIREHLDIDIDLKSVAQHAGMSHYHFSRIFHQETGESFTRFVSRMRCNLALEMLTSGEFRVSEIAFNCGFQSLSQFNRSFVSFFGKNPTSLSRELENERVGKALSSTSGKYQVKTSALLQPPARY